MADFTSGRAMASSYAVWALINLLVAGPALGLLSAYDAATDGTLRLRYPIFSTHCSMILMGGCVPIVFALVYWLFPLLKERALGRTHVPAVCLAFLILPTVGLGAYLFLSHAGYSSLYLLPIVWVLYLVAGVLYALAVWRLTARTLRPTPTDMGIQAGSMWLLVILVLRVIVSLGAVHSGRHDFFAASDAALRFAMLFGFVGNTTLALAASIAPAFLGTPPARPTVLTGFRVYNTALAIWCGGAAWVLAYPFSFGRLVLAAAGFAFAYSVISLLMHLRLPELLMLPARGARRLLARTALATGAIMMVGAGLMTALIGVWSAATLRLPPGDMISLPMHLMAVGFFANLVLALYIPISGRRSMAHLKGVLAWSAYALLVLWLIAKAALGIKGIVTNEALWHERYLIGWLVAGGLLLLALWLVSALHGRDSRA